MSKPMNINGAIINDAIVDRIIYLQEENYCDDLLCYLRKISKHILDESDGDCHTEADKDKVLKLLRYVSEFETIISDFAVKI
jgi:hypothetical protein